MHNAINLHDSSLSCLEYQSQFIKEKFLGELTQGILNQHFFFTNNYFLN